MARPDNLSQLHPLCVFSVRYEGNDTLSHEIDLNQLGYSIQGFARVFTLCARALGTGTLGEDIEDSGFRVVSIPVTEHHCFEVLAIVKGLATSRELWSGAFGAVLAAVVQYVLSRRDSSQMKYLNEALQRAEALERALQNRQEQDRLLSEQSRFFSQTVEKMTALVDKLADILRPAARQALTPVDESCQRIDLYMNGEPFMTLNREHKQGFASEDASSTGHLALYTGVISGLDMVTGECKVTLEGATSRTPAVITDPVCHRPNNCYAEAMVAAYPLRFLARAESDDAGRIVKLHISGAPERGLDFVWK